jgi:hypothetical protein
MADIYSTLRGRSEPRQARIQSSLLAFDNFQYENDRLDLQEMTSSYIASEFPAELAMYVEHLIMDSGLTTQSSIEVTVRDTLQAIKELFGKNEQAKELDQAFMDALELTYLQFSSEINKSVKKRLSGMAESGMVGNVVADFTTGPLYTRCVVDAYHYALPHEEDAGLMTIMAPTHDLVSVVKQALVKDGHLRSTSYSKNLEIVLLKHCVGRGSEVYYVDYALMAWDSFINCTVLRWYQPKQVSTSLSSLHKGHHEDFFDCAYFSMGLYWLMNYALQREVPALAITNAADPIINSETKEQKCQKLMARKAVTRMFPHFLLLANKSNITAAQSRHV